MKSTKRIGALLVFVCALVLCVVPIASAHEAILVATLDCNGTVSWTFTTNDWDATFTLNDSNSGGEGTHSLTGGTDNGGAGFISTSGTYTVASGVTSGT